MFTVEKQGLPQAGEYACFKWPKTNTVYFAVGDVSVGNIDPFYVLLAYAFNQSWYPGTIWTTYTVPDTWKVAAKGLAHLAKEIPATKGFTYALAAAGDKKAFTEGKLNYVRVSLDGKAPPEGQVITKGDIYTPNAHNFHTVPRLYLLAALAIEGKLGASVAALIVNQRGQVLSMGTKTYGERGCGHAEVRALFGIKGQVSKGWAVFSSLKPCTMCAGLIHALKGTDGRQFWARDDPSNGASAKSYKDNGIDTSSGRMIGKYTEGNYRFIKVQDGKEQKDFADQFAELWKIQSRQARKGKVDGEGIIEFIGHDKSASLRDAARQTLAAKFVKYGKSAAEAKDAVGKPAATLSRAKPVKGDENAERMQEVADHLYAVVNAAKRA